MAMGMDTDMDMDIPVLAAALDIRGSGTIHIIEAPWIFLH
jgi:hypothetical protein